MAANQEDHTRVHTTRQGEVPGDEQYSACEHEEARVAEGEFEANAQTRGSSHASSLGAGIWWCVDLVSGAGDGGDDPGLAQPFAQSRDGDAHGVGERVCVLVPCSGQEFLGADDAAFGGDEDFEHCELFPGERDVAAVAVDLSAEWIQTETCDLAYGWSVVGAPAVECSETEHELSELERLGEVVVSAELEPGGLVVEAIGGGEHEDRHAAAGGDDVVRDLVAGGSGDVPVEDCDVVGVQAQQLQRGVPVTGDVCRDRLEAQAIADGFRHVGLILDDQNSHAPMLEPAHIVGISRIRYVPATPGCLEWRHGLQQTGTNDRRSDPDSQGSCRRSPTRDRCDRRSPRPPVPGGLVLDGRITDRRPSQ